MCIPAVARVSRLRRGVSLLCAKSAVVGTAFSRPTNPIMGCPIPASPGFCAALKCYIVARRGEIPQGRHTPARPGLQRPPPPLISRRCSFCGRCRGTWRKCSFRSFPIDLALLLVLQAAELVAGHAKLAPQFLLTAGKGVGAFIVRPGGRRPPVFAVSGRRGERFVQGMNRDIAGEGTGCASQAMGSLPGRGAGHLRFIVRKGLPSLRLDRSMATGAAFFVGWRCAGGCGRAGARRRRCVGDGRGRSDCRGAVGKVSRGGTFPSRRWRDVRNCGRRRFGRNCGRRRWFGRNAWNR